MQLIDSVEVEGWLEGLVGRRRREGRGRERKREREREEIEGGERRITKFNNIFNACKFDSI